MRTRALLLTFLLTAVLGGCVSTTDRVSVRQPLLGGGHGVDHVTILTSDLAAAANEYATQLGFTVGTVRDYPFGFSGANIYFEDGSYLELYGIHDAEKVVEVGEGFAVDAPQGVRWMTLHVRPLSETVDLLRERGIPAWGPFDLPEGSGAEWTHRLGGPEEPVFPGGRVYFVEYNDEFLADRDAETLARRRARAIHANDAIGLRSVWIDVQDLEAAAATYESAGLIPGPAIRLDVLDTGAREIRTPGGTILLVQTKPDAATGTVNLQQDSFSGISIRVRNLDTIRARIREAHSLDLAPYRGLYGRSVLLPAHLARGVSIEFFE